jgi:hypothetical protein
MRRRSGMFPPQRLALPIAIACWALAVVCIAGLMSMISMVADGF